MFVGNNKARRDSIGMFKILKGLAYVDPDDVFNSATENRMRSKSAK